MQHLSARVIVEQKHSGEAAEYLNMLINTVKANTTYSETGNVAFDSIINYKLRNAKEKNIKLQINVSVPKRLKIDIIDVVTIIGNILDNAAEAIEEAEDKKLILSIDYKKGRILIFMENSYNGDVIQKNGEIVSKKHNNRRGYGLKNIEKSLQKYNGFMETAYTDTAFSTDILLYVQSE